jgi:predicted MPP superfamily phosphohydrolase
VTIRGVPCVAVGHEGPWFRPPPDLSAAPVGPFRLCLSHTPDNFYWGLAHGIGLMLCGHVHGGQIRIPVVGSIFVPSIYGRRFDTGVFAGGGMVAAVGRGLSGKEPLRFRCRPQVIRLTLRPAS